MRWSGMLVLAMPRIEIEMPYGPGVVFAEEYVTPQSSLFKMGNTLLITFLANIYFWTGWGWIYTP